MFQKPISETVRIASISAFEEKGIYDNDLYGGKKKFKKQADDLNADPFDRSIKVLQGKLKQLPN